MNCCTNSGQPLPSNCEDIPKNVHSGDYYTIFHILQGTLYIYFWFTTANLISLLIKGST